MQSISVIIPVLNEQERINGLINHLQQREVAAEIIVVDGNPVASTIAVITDPAIIKLTAPKGRGYQLAAGASRATGDLLLMLHADTLLPDNAFHSILTAIDQGAAWGAFRLGIDAPDLSYRIIERMVDLRCKLFTLPYGDQAIFVTRTALHEIGGIPAIPLMEDVELSRNLHRSGSRFILLSERVATSPRRWQKDGIIRRTLCNWWLLLSYLLGNDPHKLEKLYRSI